MGITFMFLLPPKRLKIIDAMRGVAILFMIPFHIFLFSGGIQWNGAGESSALFVDLSRPLGSGLILFYFVTGMTLYVAYQSKRTTQSFWRMFHKMLQRYGAYVTIGVVVEIVFRSLVWGETLPDLLAGIFGGWELTISSPIMGLSFAAIIAFPCLLYLSRKQLFTTALVLASALTIVLYTIPLPDIALVNLFLTNFFGVFKGVPMVLFGGAIGSVLLEGRDVKKLFLLIGSGIATVYILTPAVLGRGMLHVLLAVWAYPYAITFISGICLAFVGVFQYLDAHHINLSAAMVLGRSSFTVYYGHFILLFLVLVVVGFQNVTMTVLLGDMVFSTIGIWILIYLYSRRRWGPPSLW